MKQILSPFLIAVTITPKGTGRATSISKRSSFALLTGLCIFISSCNYISPNKDVRGSVFVVTKGAGSYKLALVKIYFCKETDVLDDILAVKRDYSKEMSRAKSECDSLQGDFSTLLKERTKAHEAWLKQCNEDGVIMFRYKEDRSKAMDRINWFLNWRAGLKAITDNLGYSVERLKEADAGLPDTQPPDENLHPHKDYSADFNDYLMLVTLNKINDKTKPNPAFINFQKDVGDLNNAAELENQKLLLQKNIERELEAKQSEFRHAIEASKAIPNFIAKQSLRLTSKAALTATTDEDGQFTLSVPKNLGQLVVVASADREVSPNDTETYFWFVLFDCNKEQSPTFDLDNNNELFSGQDGESILQLPPLDISAYNYEIQLL